MPDKSIQDSKDEWNRLAEENHRYYIVSKDGREIDEAQFSQSGIETYESIVAKDQLLAATLGSFAGKRVLDIGCGTGRLSERFAQHFAHVDGVDISESMVAKGGVRLAHVPNVELHATDGMHYPFPNGTFDLVFSYIVFQHMPSISVIEENFREIRRVLKPTGIAKIQLRGGRQPRKGTWYYGPAFTAKDATRLADAAGLEIICMGDDSVKRFWLWMRAR